jgi:hypothetical protein
MARSCGACTKTDDAGFWVLILGMSSGDQDLVVIRINLRRARHPGIGVDGRWMRIFSSS